MEDCNGAHAKFQNSTINLSLRKITPEEGIGKGSKGYGPIFVEMGAKSFAKNFKKYKGK